MSSTGCLRLKSPKSTNYCQVTGSLLPRTPAELQFLFTGTIETKRSVTTLPCDTHECRRTIVFVAISLRHPACIWFNAYIETSVPVSPNRAFPHGRGTRTETPRSGNSWRRIRDSCLCCSKMLQNLGRI